MKDDGRIPTLARHYPSRSSRMLVRATWITGLILPSLVGLIAMGILQSRGIPVVSLGEGLRLVIPFTLFVSWPFAILAWVLNRIFTSLPASDRGLWVGWNIVAAGAFLGLSVALGYYIIEPMLYSGPGGFAEVVSMMVLMWMITLPLLLAISIGGVVSGGVIGALFALVISFVLPRWFSGD